MNSYPEDLAPKSGDSWDKEDFTTWWERAGHAFSGVPRNVARQWLHRHWGYSNFAWMKSAEYTFELNHWNDKRIMTIQIFRDTQEKYREWGAYLNELGGRPKQHRPRLQSIMRRRGAWPAPPIILENTGTLEDPYLGPLPKGYVLIEGNRRLAQAFYLIANGRMSDSYPVWLMRQNQI